MAVVRSREECRRIAGERASKECAGRTHPSSRASCASAKAQQYAEECFEASWRAKCKTVFASRYADLKCSSSTLRRTAEERARKACAGSGSAYSSCMSSYQNSYLDRYCRDAQRADYIRKVCSEPRFDYREYVSHVSPEDAQIRRGRASSSSEKVNCINHPRVLAMANHVYKTDPNSPWGGVRGLDGLLTLQRGSWKEVDYPYIPAWPQNQRGSRFIKWSNVNRTKMGGRDVLSAEAPGCRQPGLQQSGWWIIDPQGSGLPAVDSSRVQGVTRSDKIAYIRDTRNENGCEFIGKPVTEAAALKDVGERGVSSRYFAVHPGWGSLDEDDAKIASRNPTSAALYFMEPSSESKELRSKLRANLQHQRAVERTRVQAETWTEALNQEEANQLLYNRFEYPEMPLTVALDLLIKRPLPSCSDVQKKLQQQLQLQEEQKEIEADIQDIYAFRLQQLEEAGLLMSDPTKERQDAASTEASGSAWLKLAVVAAAGFVGYKFLTRK